MTTRRFAWLAVPILLATTLAACGSGGNNSSAGNPITIGIGEPQHLLPSNTVESNGTQVIVALWTPLITYDSAGAPVMAAADSITSNNQKVWTINLKPGWTFANGEPVTSDSYIN